MMSIPFAKSLVFALVCAASAAQAAPIMQIGGSYGYRVHPHSSTLTSITGLTFDGVAESFSLATFGGPATNVTINESQTDLGGGFHSVFISLQADGDLYPTAGDNGFVDIGRAGNDPLDLLRQARLRSAVVSMFAGNTLVVTADFVSIFSGSFSGLNPWDGYFMNPLGGGGFTGVGGLGVDRVELTFGLQEAVPEPQTLALVLGSLLLLGATRRRGV